MIKMNLFNSNIQDEITFQMGLNLRLYQEIEQIMKRLDRKSVV